MVGLSMIEDPVKVTTSLLQFRASTSYMFASITSAGSIFLVIIYFKLYLHAKAKIRVDIAQMATRGNEEARNEIRRQQIKMATAAIAVAATYIVCLIPISIIDVLLVNKGDYMQEQRILGPLAMLNCVLDPLIYALTIKSVKEGFITEWYAIKQWFRINVSREELKTNEPINVTARPCDQKAEKSTNTLKYCSVMCVSRRRT